MFVHKKNVFLYISEKHVSVLVCGRSVKFVSVCRKIIYRWWVKENGCLMNDMIQIPQFDADTRHISQALE